MSGEGAALDCVGELTGGRTLFAFALTGAGGGEEKA
jgi:hypothetical protein